MARTKVKQETINKIASMGMANALKHAHDNDDPEFREAVKRYYPKAKYGPKTAAMASKSTVTPASSSVSEKPKFQGTGPGGWVNKRVEPAVARRVEPKKSMRGVDQKKAILPGPKGWKTWPWDKDKPNKPQRKMWPGDKPKKKTSKKVVGYARNGEPRYK